MSSTVKKVLAKIAPPALTANDENEPSDSYQAAADPVQATRRSTSRSPVGDSDQEPSRRHSLKQTIIDSIRQRRSNSLSRSSLDDHREANGDAHHHTNGAANLAFQDPRPSTQNIRQMSMTEQREMRKVEREEKEESEAEQRRRRHRQAWENVSRSRQ